jgi:hypothetical protein
MDFFLVEDDDDDGNVIKINNRQKAKLNTGCWAIDYSPNLKTIALSERILSPFKQLVADKEIPYHINIQGVSGSSKWTIIRAMIWECFSINLDIAYKTRECEHVWYSGHVFMSDMTPLTNLEAINTIKYLKNLSRQSGFAGMYKVIIIKNIDTLSKSVQLGLCKIYENALNVRVISTTCKYNSQIHPNLKSRIAVMLLPKMTEPEIKTVIQTVITENKSNKLAASSDIMKVYRAVDYNLRDTLLIIQGLCNSGERFKTVFINQLINECLTLMTASKTIPETYTRITQALYAILSLGIPAVYLMRMMIKRIVKHQGITEIQKKDIISIGGNSSYNLACGDKPIFHLEKMCFEILDVLGKF